MTRGIHLKQLTPTALGHFGLPLELLEETLEGARAADDRAPAALGDARAAAAVREVRAAAEDALRLLTEALPPQP
jgi:hypothetical protein